MPFASRTAMRTNTLSSLRGPRITLLSVPVAVLLTVSCAGKAVGARPRAAPALTDCAASTGVLPVPQRCTLSGDATLSIEGSGWVIAADLADTHSRFVATFLRAQLNDSVGVELDVVDTSSVTNATTRLMAVGNAHGSGGAALARLAAARGIQWHHSELEASEGYVLEVSPSSSSVFIAGADDAGAFYGAVSLAAMTANASGASSRVQLQLRKSATLRAWRVVDYPDLGLRGYEVEESFTDPALQWFTEVADVMAMLKLNFVLLEIPTGLSYNTTTASFVPPPVSQQATIDTLMSYFAARHIAVALTCAGKWDPRTLEGKAVTDEPFVFGPDGVATAVRPSETGAPVNGGFEKLRGDGTPVGWTLDRGSDRSLPPPCAVDTANAAEGNHSIKCDVEFYPQPDPFGIGGDAVTLGGGVRAGRESGWRRPRGPGSALRSGSGSEPMHFNYSGPLSSEAIPVLPGSTYVIRFKASWRGNWSGAFVASVSLFQYASIDEVTASENPTNPKYPFTLNFVPCTNGDHGHCSSPTQQIPRLPEWGSYYTTFMTMPEARFVRVRSYVGGWGAGQWWLDDFALERVDGQLKNVIRTPLTDLVVRDAATGEKRVLGRDYAVTPAALDASGNWSRLEPFAVRRLPGGGIAPGGRVNISYDFVPGNANQMVGGRDVSCYVEPLYYELLEQAVRWVVDRFKPPLLVADGFDEQMGMGRDSRTLASGRTNGDILGGAISRVNRIVRSASGNRTRLVIWADMVVPDHNGGANYSWLAGDGRREPYWPAVSQVDPSVLLLSWTYGVTDYDRRIIADDVGFMHEHSLSWAGCPWTELANVELWAAAMQESRARYGDASGAQGMVCTNWGGGRIETGLAPTARKAWNLGDPLR